MNKEREAYFSLVDWAAFARDAAIKKESTVADKLIRDQFGLRSDKAATVTPAMESGWNKLCASADRIVQLERSLLKQICDAQIQARREREAELAFMVKHEAQL